MNDSGDTSRRWRVKPLFAALAVAVGAAAVWVAMRTSSEPLAADANAKEKAAPMQQGQAAGKPALTVSLISAQSAEWPRLLLANGSIAPWQEAVIGAEISNYRLTEVNVNVGDTVRKGQVLARVSSDNVATELAQSKAALAEAQATVAEARANAERARQLQTSGAISAQQINQYLTAEQTALARVHAAQARVQADELRLAQTRVVAPDDGVISARTATVGSLAQPGQELFRLVRGSRLEWRAEVTEAELARVRQGAIAKVTTPNGNTVRGRVRMVAPTVDPQTRNGIVFVDLPIDATGTVVRAGMFARGEFELGTAPALTLPQSAVVLREGFAYVFRLDGESRVAQTKVSVGRRAGDRIEITGGLDAAARVVASGAGFLADGDLVRVAPATPAQPR
ncbi:MAG TPA: efflux RND transporter periplasmic adaptor subunit [Rhodocyclaceae bacterium]|nr:efflux RND transporter periplasmic adaptor subunit [Rhodocyclaceae bacterium]HMZ82979.1 efflux RND transporter periplasmic adaptor subunit [Rhodocyclaceae bacterium]HNA03053.1 efflux RND transporter periplasmic adaptor subunit [Rhodocyclaceae bacterium]HNB76951.1 efflux RND transporter periplasmic adaptor subunit [Rhodocyclaceae bacterium]HNH12119.1 efflux RND transporter periplasmic adaptor subunit [Rhodocyclaceae bacterium]